MSKSYITFATFYVVTHYIIYINLKSRLVEILLTNYIFFQKMGQSHHQRQWKEKQRNFNLNEYQKKEREGVQVHK